MSLVAYAASSDDDATDSEDDHPQQAQAILVPKTGTALTVKTAGDCISDDDDDVQEYSVQDLSLDDLKRPTPVFVSLALPKPKNVATTSNLDPEEELDTVAAPTFAKLPQPKGGNTANALIEEEDDEFLRKKAEPLLKGAEIEKPPAPKGPVRISIPSLKNFADVDADSAKLSRKNTASASASTQSGSSGLLSLLPVAKSEQNFAAKPKVATPSSAAETKQPPPSMKFIPDTVKNRRPAYNTEGVDGLRTTATRKPSAAAVKPTKSGRPLVECSDSEDDDNVEAKGGDFFSLQKEDKLPEVNANEIEAMVAKKAAKMAETKTKYLQAIGAPNADDAMVVDYAGHGQRDAEKRHYQQQLDPVAIEALDGFGNRKRRRKHGDPSQSSNIQIVDIKSDEIMPDREEWMRSALAASSTYQATGILNDDEIVAGTKRKHQITYLAHKAKANEAELQAMWSANRQSRRATQGKYGF